MRVEGLKEAVLPMIDKIAEKAVRISVDDIISELPAGKDSTIADKISVSKTAPFQYDIKLTSPVWNWLNYGTGLYGPLHKKITPKKAKALHFKNAQIAAALGFPTEDVFLASVKGIKPRYFWQRHFGTSMFQDALERASKQ